MRESIEERIAIYYAYYRRYRLRLTLYVSCLCNTTRFVTFDPIGNPIERLQQFTLYASGFAHQTEYNNGF